MIENQFKCPSARVTFWIYQSDQHLNSRIAKHLMRLKVTRPSNFNLGCKLTGTRWAIEVLYRASDRRRNESNVIIVDPGLL